MSEKLTKGDKIARHVFGIIGGYSLGQTIVFSIINNRMEILFLAIMMVALFICVMITVWKN